MPTAPDGMREYRKTATVFARRLEAEEVVHVDTLEGPAVGRRGDYLLQANTDVGERWICRGDGCGATYAPVDDTQGFPAL